MIDVARIIKRVRGDPDYVACLHEEEITQILTAVKRLFEKEEALIELGGSVVFIGDLHGDFQTAKAIVHRFFICDHLVFLGDYIDREPVKWGSLLTLTYLLTLKCQFPQKIVLLKGNHECNYLLPCCPYEFEQEILQRFGSSALHEEFVKVFSEMPLMVRAHKVFVAHGGIVKEATLTSLRKIGKNEMAATASLVWSDPVLSRTYRGVGDRFNEQELLKFLEGIAATVFVRGHDYSTLGYSIYGDRCLTLFSSSQYKREGNTGILVAQVDHQIASVSDLSIFDFSTGRWRKYQVVRL